jgi:recombination DNA repair RAD52 pathway protein
MFSDQQIAELSADLKKSNVKSRTQSGRSLSYIEGWHAIAEANRIFGFGAWDRETIDVRCVAERPRTIGKAPHSRDGFSVSYVAKVRVDVSGVVREGWGAGHGIDADLGLAHESAIKEAETDAMKRALMTFGNPFGLALYDKAQANVSDDDEPPPPPDYEKAAIDAIDALKTQQEVGDWWRAATGGLKSSLNGAQFKRVKEHVVARGNQLAPITQPDEKDAA